LLLEQVQASTVVGKLCRRVACRPLDRLEVAACEAELLVAEQMPAEVEREVQ
jgi:hypothetical protein